MGLPREKPRVDSDELGERALQAAAARHAVHLIAGK